MRPLYHYQLHVAHPIFGWMTIIFGILALIAGYYAFVKKGNRKWGL